MEGSQRKSTRDNQRKRLYDAERTLDTFHDQLKDGSVATMQAFVDSVTRSAWWRNRGGPAVVMVKDGHGTRTAYATRSTISLPRWARTKIVCLHELAHVLTKNGVAPHGPEYAATFLAIVRRFDPDAAPALKDAFKVKHVKARGAPVSKPEMNITKFCRFCGRRAWEPWVLKMTIFCTKRCALAWAAREVKRATSAESEREAAS